MATKYTYIYCRISADQHGRAEGVQAQERWGREYADQHWPGVPVKIFVDNDLSAAKDNVVRPDFERMREGIRAGECVNLWCVEQSRLTRRETEWFQLVKELVKAGVSEVHTNRGGVVDVEGVVAGIMSVLSAYEVKQLRKRLLDKKAELARQGRWGGSSIPLGYRARILTEPEQRRLSAWREERHQARIRGGDMRRWKEDHPRPVGGAPVLDEQGRKTLLLVPEEAAIVKQAARRILDGWSLTNVAMDFNRRGIRGPKGGRFVPTTVSDMLTSPMIAGYLSYQGEIVGKGTWEPILDEATWRALRAVIGSRRKSRHRVRRSYLLTGYRMFCGCCGKPMQARPSGEKFGYYACEPKVTDGCGKNSIDAVSTEAHVAVQLFKHLEEHDAAGMLSSDEHADRRGELVNELQALDGRRADLSEMWSARTITTEQFGIMNDGLNDEQARIEQELADLPAPIGDMEPAQLRQAWPEMTLDEKRKVIDDWIEQVVIHPRTRELVTMDVVARRAGVSQATVCSILRGKPWGNEGTVRRVMAAVEETGYEYLPAYRQHPRPSVDPDRAEIIWRR